ncbi:hypothetical protein HYFRA_00012573 [Hymenoscyphus fraxineus]|uniref:Uncharacterized protein n=1 Tax=Hymenoscyphus fraxineus TaxID=746836 RepID=A0A9N9L2W4_9HELO|nr:hypothetical protein HYFRA_00012573 [Hymenoscyphus fraxineus]
MQFRDLFVFATLASTVSSQKFDPTIGYHEAWCQNEQGDDYDHATIATCEILHSKSCGDCKVSEREKIPVRCFSDWKGINPRMWDDTCAANGATTGAGSAEWAPPKRQTLVNPTSTLKARDFLTSPSTFCTQDDPSRKPPFRPNCISCLLFPRGCVLRTRCCEQASLVVEMCISLRSPSENGRAHVPLGSVSRPGRKRFEVSMVVLFLSFQLLLFDDTYCGERCLMGVDYDGILGADFDEAPENAGVIPPFDDHRSDDFPLLRGLVFDAAEPVLLAGSSSAGDVPSLYFSYHEKERVARKWSMFVEARKSDGKFRSSTVGYGSYLVPRTASDLVPKFVLLGLSSAKEFSHARRILASKDHRLPVLTKQMAA